MSLSVISLQLTNIVLDHVINITCTHRVPFNANSFNEVGIWSDVSSKQTCSSAVCFYRTTPLGNYSNTSHAPPSPNTISFTSALDCVVYELTTRALVTLRPNWLSLHTSFSPALICLTFICSYVRGHHMIKGLVTMEEPMRSLTGDDTSLAASILSASNVQPTSLWIISITSYDITNLWLQFTFTIWTGTLLNLCLNNDYYNLTPVH